MRFQSWYSSNQIWWEKNSWQSSGQTLLSPKMMEVHLCYFGIIVGWWVRSSKPIHRPVLSTIVFTKEFSKLYPFNWWWLITVLWRDGFTSDLAQYNASSWQPWESYKITARGRKMMGALMNDEDGSDVCDVNIFALAYLCENYWPEHLIGCWIWLTLMQGVPVYVAS